MSSDADEPELIPQEHGGALLSGGVPGHLGGGGRPPSAIRGTMREKLERALEALDAVIEAGASPPEGWRPADVLRALDIVAKHALKVSKAERQRYRSPEEVEEIACAMAHVVREHVSDPETLERIGAAWRAIEVGG